MTSARLEGKALADLVAAARPAVVGVLAGGNAGTGWAALGNGLVVTAFELVGYAAEVDLLLDDGRHARGRVIAVGVGRGLAYVLPLEPLGLSPAR